MFSQGVRRNKILSDGHDRFLVNRSSAVARIGLRQVIPSTENDWRGRRAVWARTHGREAHFAAAEHRRSFAVPCRLRSVRVLKRADCPSEERPYLRRLKYFLACEQPAAYVRESRKIALLGKKRNPDGIFALG